MHEILKKAIIVDLDGTLCDSSQRKKYVNGTQKKNWKRFYEDLVHDYPNEWCKELVYNFFKNGCHIIFITGRPEEYRDLTLDWLEKHLQWLSNFDLHMRPRGDYRKDYILKQEIFDEHVRYKYNVLFCIDDRKQVVDGWRSIGLTCLQCDEGDF